MIQTPPLASVVVPTRGRPAPLSRTLGALAVQDFPGRAFEVIVVDDGAGSDAVVPAQLPALPCLRVLRNAGCGAAAARNTGAAAARSGLLLFLDDDVEASRGLVAAHFEAHRSGASLTTGHLPADPTAACGFFAITLRNWWASMFAEMARPGHRSGFRDVLTGNCAVDAELFRRAGGFDASLRCHEDYELGFRAIEAGASVSFVPAAEGVHHEATTLDRSLERKRAEGEADVAIARKHPALARLLPVFSLAARQRRLRTLVFRSPQAAALLLSGLRRSLDLLEAARARDRWRARLYQALNLAYWQGVRRALGGAEALDQLLRDVAGAETRAPRWLRVDLAEGVRAAASLVDDVRPDAVAVFYRGHGVGDIAPEPGSERLRGQHLRAGLRADLARGLLLALALAGSVGVEARGRFLVPTAPLPRGALPLG